MGTLGHRALLQFLESNDLVGLKTFLDTRQLPIDDRDEVSRSSSFFFNEELSFHLSHKFYYFQEWSNCTYGCIG